MCRLFALRASQPTQVAGSLVSASNSLERQSRRDARNLSHDNGWGIGSYVDGQPRRVRNAQAAHEDPQYRELAASIAAPTFLAHVRRASIGAVAVRNSHPFLYRAWMFAHNGTLYGFPTAREQVRRLIPVHLRQCIEGDTDSEHAFYLVLARIEELAGSLDRPAGAELVGQAMLDTIRTLDAICSGGGDARSQFNFVMTDGRLMVASRWGNTLSWLERRGHDPADPDVPLNEAPDYHAIAIASEPTTAEAWSELPDRSILRVHPDLTRDRAPIG